LLLAFDHLSGGDAMTRTPFTRTFCLALVLGAAACGGSSTDEGGPGNPTGTFSATVTGAASANLSGEAAASTVPGTGRWGITLGVGEPQWIVFLASGQRPLPGTYPVLAPVLVFQMTEPAFSASVQTGGYSSMEGTLTLTSSSPTRVVGSFQFTAERGTVGNPEVVQVQGTFDAINYEVGGG